MRTFSANALRVTAVGVSTVVGLFLSAPGAFAGPPDLTLTFGGAPVARENITVVEFAFGFAQRPVCLIGDKGSANNEKPHITDKLSQGEFSGELRTRCFTSAADPASEYSITGALTKLSLSWTGQVAASGAVQIQIPGPCVYHFEKPLGNMTVPGVANSVGTAWGWLVKKGSNPGCGSTTATEWFSVLALESAAELEPLHTEL